GYPGISRLAAVSPPMSVLGARRAVGDNEFHRTIKVRAATVYGCNPDEILIDRAVTCQSWANNTFRSTARGRLWRCPDDVAVRSRSRPDPAGFDARRR